ncbi:slipin family protein [Thiosocius teredinicola]|uniref:slipin family protein n=1 Tax=Thiosocius teredinicola TaxID=1973002 RepID=UPI002FE4C226
MMMFKHFVVAQHERALLYRDRQLVAVLAPGVHRYFDPTGRISATVFDLSQTEFADANADLLMKTSGDLLDGYLMQVLMGDHEVGLVYRDDTFVTALAPGERKVFWKLPHQLRVERVAVDTELQVAKQLVDAIVRTKGGVVSRALMPFVYSAEVADNQVGLLFVDGEMAQALKPGYYVYWAVKRRVVVEPYDTRIQAMEVQGQEILTRDKVSLRVNLGAQYRVADAVKARADLQQPIEWLYRELQFALRQAVGSRDLDKLLEDKERVDHEVFEKVVATAAEHGFDLRSVGIRDVILPGDMKDILNQVVQAEKAAQANVIKRREETAATRSLLNTAKLMDENPTLLRLKELETLEKVTEKVDRLTVFGGLDGVLKDTVKINV